MWMTKSGPSRLTSAITRRERAFAMALVRNGEEFSSPGFMWESAISANVNRGDSP